MTHIREFYKGKNILLTGGTGFVGLSFVEKILRSFPCIGDIYMVVRPRKNASVEARKRIFKTHLVFNRLKEENPKQHDDLFRKVKFIEGDLSLRNLGIPSNTISELQNVVNIVFHSGAAINFNSPFKTYIESNLQSTTDLLDFASGCRRFECFMYVSTAYSQLRKSQTHMTEEILPHPIDPRQLLKMAATLSCAEMEANAPQLIGDWVNYYTYSKNATENLLLEYTKRFPIVIYRPGAVVHSIAEPAPYWIGNRLGFARTLMEANRGLVLFSNPDANANTVPVDYLTNGALAAIHRSAIDSSMKIFNFTTNNHPIPYYKAFHYYCNSIPHYEDKLVPRRYELLQKNDLRSGSAEEKLVKAIKYYYYFQELIYDFRWKMLTYENKNIEVLWSQLSEEEKQMLPFDVRVIDWRHFYSNMNANEFGMPKLSLDL